jgi:SulP family sulfate permease
MLQKNRFNLNEFSGSLGDLGVLIPISFALITINGYSPFYIFFFWGLAYLFAGWYFKIPLSVQPLKAMAVICIASGFEGNIIFAASILIGMILIVLSLTGVIDIVRKWFTHAMIRGLQLSLGLILANKALTLLLDSGTFLIDPPISAALNLGLLLICILLFLLLQKISKKTPVSLIMVAIGIGFGFLMAKGTLKVPELVHSVSLDFLDFNLFASALILLVIPQLPLTLGNAIYSASDLARKLYEERAERATEKRLSLSIGVSNVLIGLFGGFPICHGAGGIAAHYKFGGRTGGTMIIVGSVLILIAISGGFFIEFIYLIPVPVLSFLLLVTSLELIKLVKDLKYAEGVIVALTVACISFYSRNLFIAILIGMFCERLLIPYVAGKTKLLSKR